MTISDPCCRRSKNVPSTLGGTRADPRLSAALRRLSNDTSLLQYPLINVPSHYCMSVTNPNSHIFFSSSHRKAHEQRHLNTYIEAFSSKTTKNCSVRRTCGLVRSAMYGRLDDVPLSVPHQTVKFYRAPHHQHPRPLESNEEPIAPLHSPCHACDRSFHCRRKRHSIMGII